MSGNGTAHNATPTTTVTSTHQLIFWRLGSAVERASRSWGKPRQLLHLGRPQDRTASPRPRWLVCGATVRRSLRSSRSLHCLENEDPMRVSLERRVRKTPLTGEGNRNPTLRLRSGLALSEVEVPNSDVWESPAIIKDYSGGRMSTN